MYVCMYVCMYKLFVRTCNIVYTNAKGSDTISRRAVFKQVYHIVSYCMYICMQDARRVTSIDWKAPPLESQLADHTIWPGECMYGTMLAWLLCGVGVYSYSNACIYVLK